MSEHAQPTNEPHADAPASGVEIAPGLTVPAAALRFSYSRSSGPGGQNVNKVSTRAELRVVIADLPLRPAARHRLARLAGRKVTHEGELVIVADEHRSQPRNKAEALERLREMIVAALVEPKVRKATKPTKVSQRRRVEGKKQRGQVKEGRRRVSGGD